MKEKEIVYYTLAGHDEVLQSPRWCLEGTIQEDKFRLGLSPYAEYKEILDYAPNIDHPAAIAAISAVRDSIKPKLVSKKSRKTKTKSKAIQLPDVQHMVVEPDSVNTNEEYLRDRTDRPTHPLSTSMDK